VPELGFSFEGVEPVEYAAVPMLAAKLRIVSQPAEDAVHSIILRCQIQLEPTRRRYAETEQQRLHDLFGEPSRWARTVRPMLWMNTSISVPAFNGSVMVDLQLPCTFDFNVAATKYFHALEAGEVVVTVMFSGTIFYADADERLQATQIPWDKEASFRFPAATWHRLMDTHYPNAGWLSLQRDILDRLNEYKVRNAIPTFEQALQELLEQAEERAASQAAGGVQQ